MTTLHERIWGKHPAVRTGTQLTLGERAADHMKAVLATWTALIVVGLAIGAWILYNTRANQPFDARPYILLNLCLSCFAALQCFVLLIANKRGEQIAASIAEHTERNTEDIKTLLEENNSLTSGVKRNTDLLDEIHRHVTAIAPRAGDFSPEPEPKPAPKRKPRKAT